MSCNQPFHPSAADAMAQLDAEAPGVPFAAYGQTVFWDEPMKRILLEACEALGRAREASVGVHDLDYFSRLPEGAGQEYRVLPHNDLDTRDIWSATGELSALFGCEAWPSLERLNELKLRLNVALGPGLCGLADVTEAWGWRGVARAGGDAPVVNDLPLRDVLAPLVQLLEWAFEESCACLADRKCREESQEIGRRIVRQVREAAREPGVRTVSDLFLRLVPLMWDLVGGPAGEDAAPGRTETRTSEVFRLNTDTAKLPRFRLLDLYLDPDTTEAARQAYDAAVEGAPMYALEEFGTGAIPFDLYVPGRGRGTLFLLEGHVVAHTTPRTVIEVDRRPCTSKCLAKAIEEQIGPDAAVLGKAVTLAAMIASEFVFVLNETGSAYLDMTAQLVQGLHRKGLEFPVNPVLRLKYHTWDALKAADVRLRLPSHLAQAFGRKTLTGCEFARGWRHAAREQGSLLKRLRELRGTADILSFLSFDKQDEWYDNLRECQAAQAELLQVQHQVSGLKHQAQEIREAEDKALAAAQDLERQRGKLNRERLRPLRRQLETAQCSGEIALLRSRLARAEKEHQAVVDALDEKQAERRRLAAERKDVTQAFRRLERGDEACQARKVLAKVERSAERQRLELARNAILVTEGLPHTEARPSAWWLPLVDPSGAWYTELRRTTEFRLERLDADG